MNKRSSPSIQESKKAFNILITQHDSDLNFYQFEGKIESLGSADAFPRPANIQLSFQGQVPKPNMKVFIRQLLSPTLSPSPIRLT